MPPLVVALSLAPPPSSNRWRRRCRRRAIIVVLVIAHCCCHCRCPSRRRHHSSTLLRIRCPSHRRHRSRCHCRPSPSSSSLYPVAPSPVAPLPSLLSLPPAAIVVVIAIIINFIARRPSRHRHRCLRRIRHPLPSSSSFSVVGNTPRASGTTYSSMVLEYDVVSGRPGREV